MEKKIIFIFCISCALALSVLVAPKVLAAEDPETGITYPVAELGNCADKSACAAYCEKAENMDACIDFASNNGMISQEEAAIAKKAIVKIKAGETPGGCSSKESCESFCQDKTDNLDECLTFAQEIGVPEEKLEQAKKISAALKGDAQLPGNCNGKSACEAYCKNANHIDECLVFAEAAQILPADELAEAKKIAPLLKNGQMPGNCQGKEECKAYCEADEHFEECINFAEKAEFISKEEAEMAKKVGGKGPGGCKSKKECEDFCNLEENAETCANFALEKNLVSPEEADNIKNGVGQIVSGLAKVPPEVRPDVEACLNGLFGDLNSVISGQKKITKSQGEKIGQCFQAAVDKYAADQQKKGEDAMQAGGQGQGMPPANIEKMIENVPEEMKGQVREQIENRAQEEELRARQEAEQRARQEMEANMPQGIPSGSAPQDMPVQAPPSGIPQGSGAPSVQGPPCNSPEECQAMFGGGPPANIPQ